MSAGFPETPADVILVVIMMASFPVLVAVVAWALLVIFKGPGL